MKMLIVISEVKYSGAAKIASWLANTLASEYEKVSLVTFIDGEDCQEIHSNVERIRICKNISSRFERTGRAISQLHKLIKHQNYDIVLSFLPLEGFISVLASMGTKARTIVSERSDPYHEKTVVANISRFFFRFADGAVFQSTGAKEFYPDKLKKNSVIIENPVIKPHMSQISYENRNDEIVSSSRLVIQQKRQDILLKAFSIVAERNETVKLKLIGDGMDEFYLKELAKKMNIEHRVLFKGKSEEVLKEIRDAKVFAFSSDFEGMPNAVLEALSMGVPVVSTDYSPGGAKELIEKKNRGYVVPRGDFKQLADKILQILNNKEGAALMADNAQKICNELSEKEICQKWIKYIEKMCNYKEKKK